MTLDLNTVYLGDCLDVLKTIPDSSIDAVITDPPYGTNDQKGKTIRRGKTDTLFNVIAWDKEVPLDYLKEIERVMKPDTWGFIFSDNMFITTLWTTLEKYALCPRNTFYWIKTNKAPTPRCNFKSCVETAVCFTKDRTNHKWYGGGNQNNFINLPFVCGKEKVNHPTQKPVKLIIHLLSLVTKENDIVLDPFIGSGTTAVACINTNRNFIGIEKEKEYFDTANERIKIHTTKKEKEEKFKELF